MSWTLTAGGHLETQDEEKLLVAKLAEALESGGDSPYSTFSGRFLSGDVRTLRDADTASQDDAEVTTPAEVAEDLKSNQGTPVVSDERRYRDASTGEYVTEEYALANPDTTVAETEGE